MELYVIRGFGMLTEGQIQALQNVFDAQGVQATLTPASELNWLSQLHYDTAMSLREEGITELAQLTSLTFSAFWNKKIHSWWLVLHYMAENGLWFADANPAQLIQNDLREAGLDVRAYRRLKGEGISSVAIVAALTDEDLLEIRGIGPTLVDEAIRPIIPRA